MKDLNKVQLTGHLGADPEMRYTTQGSAVTTFRVASNRTWRDKDGNTHEETEWFRVVAWDKLGEICNQYLAKGTRVYIEGRLQTRKWIDRDGRDRYTTEVIAQEMIILSRNIPHDVPHDGDDYDDYDETPPSPSEQPPASTGTVPGRPPASTGTVPGRPPASTGTVPGRPPAPTAFDDDNIPF